MSAPAPGGAALRVALDLRHPFSYLALEPTAALAAELGAAIDWLPIEAPTLRPLDAEPGTGPRGARHRRLRAEALAREIDTYSAARGLVIREPHRDAPVEAAELAWLWLRAQRPERLLPFLREIFRGYWSLALDAGDPAAVADAVARAGADPEGLGTWCRGEGPARRRELAAGLRAAGVLQSPAYLVEDEVYCGRQHLPMLRWILAGRRGPVPI